MATETIISSTSNKAPVLQLKTDVPERGVHNIAMGGDFKHKRPVFTDKYAERKWLLEHTAAAFRAFGRRQFGIGLAGHISVRDPVNPHHFWINPLGKHFSLIKVSDFIKVDKDGNFVGGNKEGVINAAGFKIHSQIHQARPNVNAACHAHSLYGTAYSAFGKPLDMTNQDVCVFYKSHSVYEDFGGVVLEDEESVKISEALGDGKAVILQNHGLLTVGETIDEAAFLFILMEKSCQTQMLIDQNVSKTKRIISDEAAAYTYHMTSDPESLYAEFQAEYELELRDSNGDFLE